MTNGSYSDIQRNRLEKIRANALDELENIEQWPENEGRAVVDASLEARAMFVDMLDEELAGRLLVDIEKQADCFIANFESGLAEDSSELALFFPGISLREFLACLEVAKRDYLTWVKLDELQYKRKVAYCVMHRDLPKIRKAYRMAVEEALKKSAYGLTRSVLEDVDFRFEVLASRIILHATASDRSEDEAIALKRRIQHAMEIFADLKEAHLRLLT